MTKHEETVAMVKDALIKQGISPTALFTLDQLAEVSVGIAIVTIKACQKELSLDEATTLLTSKW